MKQFLSIFLLLFAAMSSIANENNTPTELLQPLNMSQYAGETSTFVIRANSKKADKVIIVQDGNKTATIDITAEKKVYCESIKLNLGANNIVVNVYNKDSIVDKYDRKLYYKSELFEGYDEYEAEEYDLNYFHTDKKEAQCKSCHNMTSNIPKNGEVLDDISKTTCYSCHKNRNRTENTHAPTVNWLCTNCHNGKFGAYNADQKGSSKYLAPDPISKTCMSCHKKVEQWTMNRYTHGPVNDGRCIRCHNPHGSNNEFFLRKPIWDLCTTCHAEKADGKHVVSSFVFGRNKGAHPTKDRKDPARPGRDFYCSSCHNPHGSKGIFLLRMKGSMPFNVCSRCHKK